MALVSVLLPVFNGADYLAQAIESLISQTFRDMRILLLNDGSTDHSLRIARWYARMDSRITVFDKPNTGLVDTLNFGLTRVESEFVARMDADDICFRSRIEEQLDYIRFSGCDAISCGFIAIGPTGEIRNHHIPRDTQHCNEWWLPALEPYLPHPFLFFRTEAVLRRGGYRYVLHAEDADLYWRLMEHGPIGNMPSLLGNYRVHAASVSAASVGNARVQAMFSQACAISRQRRVAERPDLVFNIGLAEAKHMAHSLEDVCLAFRPQLSVTEYHHLCAASGLKLLEAASWRPYEVDMVDVDFTRYYLNKIAYLHPANRQDAVETLNNAQWRLQEKLKAREAHKAMA